MLPCCANESRNVLVKNYLGDPYTVQAVSSSSFRRYNYILRYMVEEGERGGQKEIDHNDDCGRGGAAWEKTLLKGWQGDDEDDNNNND